MNLPRLIFFLLLLANLMFFAWSHGYFGIAEEGREPQRLTSQLAPEKLRILSREPAPSASGWATTATPADNNPAADAATTTACRLVNDLSIEEAQQLQLKATEKLPDLKTQLKPIEIPPGYWTFIPPQPTQVFVDKKMAELKKLNIPNFADFQPILEEGPDKFAISLGMFDEEAAANAHLKNLAKYGVRSAKLQLRSRAAEKAQIEFQGPPHAIQRLVDITSTTNIGECPAVTPSAAMPATQTNVPAESNKQTANGTGKPPAPVKKAPQ